MNTFLNERWSAITGKRGGALLVHVLRAATIAAIASSCATMQVPPETDSADAAVSAANAEEYPPPPVRALPKDIEDALSSYGYERVQFVALAYTDPEDGREKLVTLQPSESEGTDVPVPEDQFLIPPDGTNFDEAIAIYIGSPAKRTSCGRSSGGTRYCDFD